VLSEAALEARLAALFQQHKVPEAKQALLKSLALLWHDHLDAAHTIAQNIDNPDGAFVHGIMHRREPDYSNAGYWFRRVGRHAAFPELAKRSAELLAAPNGRSLAGELLARQEWDPFAFIAACERVIGRPGADEERRLVRELQRLESHALWEYFLK
jgi:hypothetical protein